MKSTSADASESRQPGLALLSYFPETNKDLSCAVELNFTIGSEVAESEPLEVDPNFKFHDEDRAKKKLYLYCCSKKATGGPTTTPRGRQRHGRPGRYIRIFSMLEAIIFLVEFACQN
jgi:hypothetical protein